MLSEYMRMINFRSVLKFPSLIAISGLGGHAFGSFKERNGEHMWLRDALPYDITREDNNTPISRVMIYGYDSSLQDSDSFQNLEDLGTSFHSSLRSMVIAGSFRPIILVAHSLGGLVVKEVCALSVQLRRPYSHMADSHIPLQVG